MRIVSFGQMAPSPTNTSAGGQFYFEHVQALRSLGHGVVTVTPTSPFDSGETSDDADGIRVRPSRAGSSSFWRQVDRFSMGGVAFDYRASVLSNAAVRDAVRRADLIEYQWVEQMALARSVERLRGAAGPSVGVVHDELVQRETRHLAVSPAARRPARALDLVQVRARERNSFRSVGHLLTISTKDAECCDRVAGRSISRAVTPPVVPETNPAGRIGRDDRAPLDVLMVGAMARPENDQGALWLIDRVWPRVRRRLPEAMLTIAGAGPSHAVQRAARHGGGVRVTGFVPELDPLYERAAVVVVPLFAGAGVKFKTIVGLAHDLPVVTTPIGAEGVLEGIPDVFARVTADPEEFASAIVQIAVEPRHEATRSARIGRLVRSTYGREGYAARLAPLLEELQDDHRRRSGSAKSARAS